MNLRTRLANWSLPVLLLAVIGAATLVPGRRPRFRLALLPFVAVVLLVIAFWLSWSRPVYGYDAVSMWALKAKVSFYAQTWPPTLFDRHTTHHPEYPPLITPFRAGKPSICSLFSSGRNSVSR